MIGGLPCFTFCWTDGTEHHLPKAACARYGPKDLSYLRDMLAVPNYHGDIFRVQTGRHGLNLCSDEGIYQDFQHMSWEEQHNALFGYLASITHANPKIAKGDDRTRQLIIRYLKWRKEHLAQLVRCLDILHTHCFAARKGKHLVNFGQGMSRARLALILDIHLASSDSKAVVRDDRMDMFVEYRPKQKPKKSPVFDQLDALCDLMIEHGEMLRNHYNFLFSQDGLTRDKLYKEFKKQHKRDVPLKYWTNGGANYMRSAFDTYALTWFPFNHMERFVRVEK